MPRRRRMYVAGMPYHVVQRGNNREACFYSVEDYQFYLEVLGELLERYGVQLHAYVLMTNHVHFLMTPLEVDGISNVTKVLGSRYARYMNRSYRRTGTLWEGRHYRHIEMNPVAASMVERQSRKRGRRDLILINSNNSIDL